MAGHEYLSVPPKLKNEIEGSMGSAMFSQLKELIMESSPSPKDIANGRIQVKEGESISSLSRLFRSWSQNRVPWHAMGDLIGLVSPELKVSFLEAMGREVEEKRRSERAAEQYRLDRPHVDATDTFPVSPTHLYYKSEMLSSTSSLRVHMEDETAIHPRHSNTLSTAPSSLSYQDSVTPTPSRNPHQRGSYCPNGFFGDSSGMCSGCSRSVSQDSSFCSSCGSPVVVSRSVSMNSGSASSSLGCMKAVREIGQQSSTPSPDIFLENYAHVHTEDPKFINRGSALENLESMLDEENFALIKDIPGSGKSLLVREYARRMLRVDPNTRFFELDLQSVGVFHKCLLSIKANLKMSGFPTTAWTWDRISEENSTRELVAAVEALVRRLSTPPHNLFTKIVLFRGLGSELTGITRHLWKVFKSMTLLRRQWKWIVTTAVPQDGPHVLLEAVGMCVPPFCSHDVDAIFKDICDTGNSDIRTDLEAIIKAVSGLPLLINTARQLLRRRLMSTEDCRGMMEKAVQGVVQGEQNVVSVTFQQALCRHVEECQKAVLHGKCNGEAFKNLWFCLAMLGPTDIPLTLLQRALSKKLWGEEEHFVTILCDFGLLTRCIKSRTKHVTLTLHSIMHKALKDYIGPVPEQALLHVLKAFMATCCKNLSIGEPSHRKLAALVHPHLQGVLTFLRDHETGKKHMTNPSVRACYVSLTDYLAYMQHEFMEGRTVLDTVKHGLDALEPMLAPRSRHRGIPEDDWKSLIVSALKRRPPTEYCIEADDLPSLDGIKLPPGFLSHLTDGQTNPSGNAEEVTETESDNEHGEAEDSDECCCGLCRCCKENGRRPANSYSSLRVADVLLLEARTSLLYTRARALGRHVRYRYESTCHNTGDTDDDAEYEKRKKEVQEALRAARKSCDEMMALCLRLGLPDPVYDLLIRRSECSFMDVSQSLQEYHHLAGLTKPYYKSGQLVCIPLGDPMHRVFCLREVITRCCKEMRRIRRVDRHGLAAVDLRDICRAACLQLLSMESFSIVKSFSALLGEALIARGNFSRLLLRDLDSASDSDFIEGLKKVQEGGVYVRLARAVAHVCEHHIDLGSPPSESLLSQMGEYLKAAEKQIGEGQPSMLRRARLTWRHVKALRIVKEKGPYFVVQRFPEYLAGTMTGLSVDDGESGDEDERIASCRDPAVEYVKALFKWDPTGLGILRRLESQSSSD